jgi:hypothetical protein
MPVIGRPPNPASPEGAVADEPDVDGQVTIAVVVDHLRVRHRLDHGPDDSNCTLSTTGDGI